MIVVLLTTILLIPGPDDPATNSEATQPRTMVFPLVSFPAQRAAQHLRQLFAANRSVIVAFDTYTNTVFVDASPVKLRRAEAILRDYEEPANDGNVLLVVSLRHLDATVTDRVVKAILAGMEWFGDDTVGDIHVTAAGTVGNPRANNLLIAGRHRQREAIARVIGWLDALVGRWCP
jgi:type II secretory pathway component GspD/PulD (secretin)